MGFFFFSSLEKAFEMKKFEESIKIEILLIFLREGTVINLCNWGKYERLSESESIILKDFQPILGACLDNFLA